jgi:dGTPase
VSAISEIVCKNLKDKCVDCNPTLARAIGLGHDLGHAPFGHEGEIILNELAKNIGGFKHEKHGLRIVDKIEKPRDKMPVVGLNLTVAVRDGIVNHCGEDSSTNISPVDSPKLEGNSYPFTVEGCVVRLVDKIAYLGRDLEDAIIAKFIEESKIPAKFAALIGTKNGEIVDYFVGDLIENSDETQIALSKKAGGLMRKLLDFNKKAIYKRKELDRFKIQIKDILEILFTKFLKELYEYEDQIHLYMNEDNLDPVIVLGKFIGDRKILYFDEESEAISDQDKLYTRIVIDFMSTLTDNYVFHAIDAYFGPKSII